MNPPPTRHIVLSPKGCARIPCYRCGEKRPPARDESPFCLMCVDGGGSVEEALRTRASPEVFATAFHEAGHVVAALAQGVDVYSASIVPSIDGDSCGRVIHEGMRENWRAQVTPNDRWQAELRAIGALAGPHAENGARSHFKWGPPTGFGQDMELTMSIAECIVRKGAVDEYVSYLSACARAIVEAEWDQIAVVADALLAKRTLNQVEIWDLCFKGKAPTPPSKRKRRRRMLAPPTLLSLKPEIAAKNEGSRIAET